LLLVAATARADTAVLVKQYAGRIVISPDPAPTLATELPAHVKANAVADDRYELIKGAPWHVHLVGFLSKDAASVQLVFADVADPKAEPVAQVDVAVKNRLVIANTDATIAAGFATGKTYAVQLRANKTVLAKAQLTLRP
jgi:hypothetical protein